MIVYKIITGARIPETSIDFDLLLRQEEAKSGRWEQWILSGLDDTPENRLYLTIKHSVLGILTLSEFRAEIREVVNNDYSIDRFEDYIRHAIKFLQNKAC